MVTTNIGINECGNALTEWRKVEYLSVSEITSHIAVCGYAKVQATKDWSLIEAGEITQGCIDNAGSYSHSIQLKVGCRSREYQNYFDQMVNDRFIIKLTDANGQSWIAGSLANPLRFTWNEEQAGSSPSATALNFSCECKYPLLPMI